jgi:hypothetical protein
MAWKPPGRGGEYRPAEDTEDSDQSQHSGSRARNALQVRDLLGVAYRQTSQIVRFFRIVFDCGGARGKG